MEARRVARYVVRCSVVGLVSYGLLTESEDSAYVTDQPGESWPDAGQQLRCVVLATRAPAGSESRRRPPMSKR